MLRSKAQSDLSVTCNLLWSTHSPSLATKRHTTPATPFKTEDSG